MSTNLDNLMRKTKSYWYEDGLAEILAGLFFIFVGLFLVADASTPPDAPTKWIYAPGLVVIVFVWVLAGRKLISWLKERITYPRTGYVAYHRQPRSKAAARRIAAMAIGAAVAMAIVAGLSYRQEIVRLVPLILGIGVALLVLRVGSEVGLVRFYALALWSVAVGAVLAWLTADLGLGIALYYALLGLAILAAGALTLYRYLRSAPAEADHE